MGYTYKGTDLKGTSKVKGKHKAAKKGNTYLNKKTGHVYKATKAGDKDHAKWAYNSTIIMKPPTLAVKNLSAPFRVSGYTMRVTWQNPGDLASKTNNKRATGYTVYWTLKVNGENTTIQSAVGEGATSADFNLNSFKVGSTTYTRASYYPDVSGKDLPNISAKVVPYNTKGSYAKNAPSSTAKFSKPAAPTLTTPTFDPETGVTSSTITTDAGAGLAERRDTWRWMEITTKIGDQTETFNGVGPNKDYRTEFPISYNATGFQGLSYDDYIRVQAKAYARGYNGNSDTVSSHPYYISFPAQVTITDIDVSEPGRCAVLINTNREKNSNNEYEHPVDKVSLEYLANTSYKTEDQIYAGASWSSADVVDDGDCSALVMPSAALVPEPGKYTWVRVVSYHVSEKVLYRYSNYMRVTGLETPAADASDDEITIISAEPGANGTSIVVHLAWDDGALPSTGTELTWSTEEDAWRSTDDPDSYTFTYNDGPVTVGQKTYPGSATIAIKGVEEAVKYYIKARRYADGDSGQTFSEYSNSATCITSETPSAVIATCQGVVPAGSSLPVYWTYSGYGLQTEWRIIQKIWYELTDDTEVEVEAKYLLTADTTVVSGKSYYEYDGSGYEAVTPSGTEDPSEEGWYEEAGESEKSYYELEDGEYVLVTPDGSEDPSEEGWYEKYGGAVIAKGNTSLGATQISAERLASFAIDNSVSFTVHISTGSGFVSSGLQSVVIADPPTISASVTSPLTAQPFSFLVESGSECDITAVITSYGSVGQYPDGIRRQASGDTVWSDVVRPSWTATSSGYSATITLPTGQDFWDGARYKLAVVATDRATGLQTEADPVDFSVEWSHQAPDITPEIAYVPTEDTAVDDSKGYWAYNSAEEAYEMVEAEGTENPSEEGWFEQTFTEYIELTPIDTIDEDTDEHRQAVQIELTPPAESYHLSEDTEVDEDKTYFEYDGVQYAEVTPSGTEDPSEEGWYELYDDVYDIYRLTGDGAYLIGYGFPLLNTTVDEFAPFGDGLTLYYRVAIRTSDGDYAYTDVEYAQEGKTMRFDWAEGSLELPYNLSIGDKYKKDVEIRNHMDGSTDAYWNSNIERKGTLSSDLIRLEQKTDIDNARQLARYPGAVFVRTPDGSAYEADVQITDLSTEGTLEALAVDATEIGLTDKFMLPTPFEQGEE